MGVTIFIRFQLSSFYYMEWVSYTLQGLCVAILGLTKFFPKKCKQRRVSHSLGLPKNIVIFKAKFPQCDEFQGIFSFAFFASFSLQRIFFAQNAKKIFFAKNLQSIDCHHHHFFNYKKIFVFARVWTHNLLINHPECE